MFDGLLTAYSVNVNAILDGSDDDWSIPGLDLEEEPLFEDLNPKKRRKMTKECQERSAPSISTTENDVGFLLHRICQQFPNNDVVVQTAMLLDPTAVHRAILLPESSTKASSRSYMKKSTQDFQYAINVALNNDASLKVVELLAQAAPEMLLQPEGGTTSLLLALLKCPQDSRTMEALLRCNPRSAHTQDSHMNTPLHSACQRGCSLSVVKAIFEANPKALAQQNFHGERPTQIAERTSMCPEDVVIFLQNRVIRRF